MKKAAQLHVGAEGTYVAPKPVDDGGPVYPQGVVITQGGEIITTGNLLPAGFQGLSLRDHFAAHAVTGHVVAGLAAGAPARLEWYESVAQNCYRIADAMIEARKK